MAKALLESDTPGQDDPNTKNLPWCICGLCRLADGSSSGKCVLSKRSMHYDKFLKQWCLTVMCSW